MRRYGRFSSLSGDSVVIDGPSLVFQILHGCMLRGPDVKGFICHPSYSIVGRNVIGWLEDLQRYNVTVRKIYFDGYLPPDKWRVRRSRLLRQSESVKDLLAFHPLGSPGIPEDAFEAIGPAISLTHHDGDSTKFRWLPKPPLLVPAVAEILKSSATWGPLVEVVSGEADVFCADDVRHHGGVLLTGDSDLLVTELGPDGSVSFFGDLVKADESGDSRELLTCKYSLQAINDDLGLNYVGGLLRVAFEKIQGKMSFAEAVARAKSNTSDTLGTLAFRAFMEQFTVKEYLPKNHPAQKVLSGLDPRISEIVVQALVLDGTRTVPYVGSNKDDRSPETLAMFLPIMIEERNRKSAWTMSTSVRQLAYGIVQTLVTHGSPAVIEYRSLGERTVLVGRKIDVPGPEEVLEQCRLLTKTLGQITERIRGADLQWLAFTIYQDISWSASVNGSYLSALLLNKPRDKSNDNDGHSWDTIHLVAQVQASLYSLRMVKQILEVTASLVAPLPLPMQELRECLRALPAIAEWPTVENLSRALASASEADVLPTIIDIFGLPAIVNDYQSLRGKQPKKKRTKISPLRRQLDPSRPRSVNPYAVLSDSSRD